ncbi:MAG: SHOCT domain-containing protein, partial [Gammaproteobacteria bacterium]|nr:SHOCT domain-containing protein [Gammaproteobacteria bacterium]
MALSDQLKELESMRERGTLSEAEFARAKARL